MLLHLLQDGTAATVGLRELGQYIANAAAVGAFAFAWRTNTRVTRLETILAERGSGIVDRVEGVGRSLDRHGIDLRGHEERLDNHDRELERLDREKETRRALGPHDVGAFDRRSSS